MCSQRNRTNLALLPVTNLTPPSKSTNTNNTVCADCYKKPRSLLCLPAASALFLTCRNARKIAKNAGFLQEKCEIANNIASKYARCNIVALLASAALRRQAGVSEPQFLYHCITHPFCSADGCKTSAYKIPPCAAAGQNLCGISYLWGCRARKARYSRYQHWGQRL